jgi:hypothetical protein
MGCRSRRIRKDPVDRLNNQLEDQTVLVATDWWVHRAVGKGLDALLLRNRPSSFPAGVPADANVALSDLVLDK